MDLFKIVLGTVHEQYTTHRIRDGEIASCETNPDRHRTSVFVHIPVLHQRAITIACHIQLY